MKSDCSWDRTLPFVTVNFERAYAGRFIITCFSNVLTITSSVLTCFLNGGDSSIDSCCESLAGPMWELC